LPASAPFGSSAAGVVTKAARLSIEMGKATLWVSFVRIPCTDRLCLVDAPSSSMDDKIGVNTQRNQNIGVKAMKRYCAFGLLSQC
jgi:hypothetical protein